MATEQYEPKGHDNGGAHRGRHREGSIKGGMKRLASDSATLIRQEILLAKLELKDLGQRLTRDAVQIGIALGIVAVGALALVACLIMVIGLLLDGAYWAGALIVGGVFLIVGGILAKSATKDLSSSEWKPDETIETLKEDQEFAKGEADDFRRRMAS